MNIISEGIKNFALFTIAAIVALVAIYHLFKKR